MRAGFAFALTVACSALVGLRRRDLAIDILKAPTFDSRPDQDGLQTTQVGEVVSTEDLTIGVPLPARS